MKVTGCVFSCVVAALLLSTPVQASIKETLVLPSELQSFVEPGTRPIEVERADLNGDGRSDFILVLEKLPTADESVFLERILLIIVRQPGGSLKVAGRGDSAIRDDQCGGQFGDCFEGVSAKDRAFTISEFGGSGGFQWSHVSTFRFSSRDRTWQLVRVEDQSFSPSNPSKVKRNVYVPPRDFGKIDISEYDPEGFLGQGLK
jgi:hypothetical protein